jgi:hypothetical protein
VSGSWQSLTNNSANTATVEWEGKASDQTVLVGVNAVDFGFVETMGITLVEGRSFRADIPGDSIDGFLVNESMARIMGGESAVGKTIRFPRREGKVVGVVKDYHRKPVQSEIEPLILSCIPGFTNFIIVRLGPGDLAMGIESVSQTWSRVVPGYPFEGNLLENELQSRFYREASTANLLTSAALLAMLTACLGLFGLASHSCEQRRKEIGIRRVCGATIGSMGGLLLKEFLILVGIANVIAWPIAYLLTDDWLERFAYRIDLGPGTFAVASVITLIIALLTVSHQVVKIAYASPVSVIRDE